MTIGKRSRGRIFITAMILLVLIASVTLTSVTSTALAAIPLASSSADLQGGNVVISQIYGGGGNSGATYKNDFIELYNPTASIISLSGWSVQYASAAGSTWQVTPLAGAIAPGGYYLIQQAQGAGGTVNLPTPNVIGNIAMSATAGKVALVNTTTSLSGTCPVGAQIIDFVGFGSTANCFEGSGPTATLSNTTAALRLGNGATDTDQNAADFATGAPNPRSSSDQAPAVSSTTPANAAAGVARNASLTVQFSEAVNVTGSWFSIACSISGAHSAAVSGGPTTFSLDPDVDFAANESCTVTILAAQVTDQDSQDPPDQMVANHIFSFTTTDTQVCGDPATLIHTIQGSGVQSGMKGTNNVSIEGIVIGDYQAGSQLRGFHLQEEDIEADSDPATSEGIFVFDNGFGVDVQAGDRVRVKGTVVEFETSSNSGAYLTELSNVSSVIVCGNNNTVTPATVSLPVSSLSDWERYEGMLVHIPQDLTVTENFTLGRFGEVSLSAGGRLYNPTSITTPGAAAVAQQDLNNRSRILLDDANGNQNIDPTLYPSGGLSAANTLRSGYTVSGITGVLEQRFSVYRIQPVGAIAFNTDNPRPAPPTETGGRIQVASFNVLNYFNGNGQGGGFPTPRGANSSAEFERQRAKIIAAITQMNAEVVGLMELENDVPPNSAIEDLISGLNAATAPGTYAFINTGVIGTDEIRVGLIYRPAAVTPLGAYAILDSGVDARFIDTLNRPVLAQTFEENGTGARFTVAVNHLKSKGSDCEDVNDPDTGDGQGNCNLTRTQAAAALVDWLATDPTGSGDSDFLIIGDLNSYAQEDPIVTIEGAGYTNLVAAFSGSQAYSYVFQGQSGYLDHALSNASLTGQVSGLTEWHINADEPIVLDYNVEFKTANQVNSFYAADPYRSSDHDPVLIGLDLNRPPAVDAGGPYQVIEGSSVVVNATGSDADGDSLSYAWDLDNNGSFETSGQSATFSAAGLTAPSSYTVKVQASDSLGNTAVDEATVFVIYPFNGFFPPISNYPDFNEVKAGSGVPLKFSLGGDRGLNIFAAGFPQVNAIACDPSDPGTPISETVTAGSSSLSYDPLTGEYVYVWKTNKSWAGTCRQVVIQLNDGTVHLANFRFVR